MESKSCCIFSALGPFIFDNFATCKDTAYYDEYQKAGSFESLHNLNVKTHGAEAVVAAHHCAEWVFHPAIEEIAFSSCEGFHELAHSFPRLRAKAFGTSPVDADPRLTFTHVTSVFDWVFVFCHQVIILNLANGGNLYLHRVNIFPNIAIFAIC